MEVTKFSCCVKNCPYSVGGLNNLSHHMIAQHYQETSISCVICDEVCTGIIFLILHFEKHVSEEKKPWIHSSLDIANAFMKQKYSELTKFLMSSAPVSSTQTSEERSELRLIPESAAVAREKLVKPVQQVKAFKCDYVNCDFSTDHKTNLREHVNIKHLNLEGEKCWLKECKHIVPRWRDNAKHLMKHFKEYRKIQCSHCNEELASMTELVKHYEAHLPPRRKKVCLSILSSVRHKAQEAYFNTVESEPIPTEVAA